MLKKLGLLLLVVVLAIVVLAVMKPDDFHVQRTTSINAPPEEIVGLITDFRAWSSWSPFERLDPAMKRTYSGAASGEGAVYEVGPHRRSRSSLISTGRLNHTTSRSSPSSRRAARQT